VLRSYIFFSALLLLSPIRGFAREARDRRLPVLHKPLPELSPGFDLLYEQKFGGSTRRFRKLGIPKSRNSLLVRVGPSQPAISLEELSPSRCTDQRFFLNEKRFLHGH